MHDTIELAHNRVRLALHQLREPASATAPHRPLLLLHGLGERIPEIVPDEVTGWPGAIWGLDFTGHGASSVPRGGGYTCELLMADVDVALHHLGQATLYGRGLGAYVGLLVAGARPDLVRGVVLADGPGLSGGGTRPGSFAIGAVDLERPAAVPDPFALFELARDVRPVDYAQSFAREAVRGSSLDVPVIVAAFARPDWLRAVAEEYGVETLPVARALQLYAER